MAPGPSNFYIIKDVISLNYSFYLFLTDFLMAVFTALLEPFPEGTRNPEKGVDAEEGECTKQQAGHRPERIEQEGILIPVMMGCVGQVTGKFTV